MNTRTDLYQPIVQSLQTAKARARANKKARNRARADLRAHLAYRLTSGQASPPAGLLEFMNNRIRDLEMATEADAQTTLIAKLISNLVAEEAWEEISGSLRKIPATKPAT